MDPLKVEKCVIFVDNFFLGVKGVPHACNINQHLAFAIHDGWSVDSILHVVCGVHHHHYHRLHRLEILRSDRDCAIRP